MDSSKEDNQNQVQHALRLLKLSEPFSRDTLQQHYEEAKRIWYPSRYAGLTNNPGKYMEMYKKGEAKTQEIQEAYQLLLNYLHAQQESHPPPSPCEPSPDQAF